MGFVTQKFKHLYNRSTILIRYIFSFEILYITFFVIIFNIVFQEIYLNIFSEIVDLKNFILFLLLSTLVYVLLGHLWVWYVPHRCKEGAHRSPKTVQKISLLLIQCILLLVSVCKDYQEVQKVSAFTGVESLYIIEIEDIDRGRGDVLEVIFKLDGVKGVGYIDWFEDVKIGDICEVYGDVKQPENFSDFNYKQYLRKKNIYLYSSRLSFKSCNFEMNGMKLGYYPVYLRRGLRYVRDVLSSHIEENLPEPQASLLIGILFGSERAFSKDFEENLRVSGTTHIIAASGYNVTILIMLCSKIFGFLSKKVRLVVSLVVIWLFCIFSGLSASILRATVMGSITILALLTGSLKNIHILIPTGLFFLVLIDQKILMDIGFQLSMLATLGLVYLMPSILVFCKKFFKVGKWFEEYFLSTLSCTLATLPISISVFGKLSLVSVFANMLILPLTESTMLYGAIGMFIPWFFSVVYFQLKVFEYVVNLFGSISIGYIDISRPWVGLVIGFILILFCVYFYPVDGDNYYVRRYYDI